MSWRIDKWQIASFGHFSEADPVALDNGLNVLLGPNEAGKSTLLDYVTWMLFGTKALAPPRRGLANGADGQIFLQNHAGTWQIARDKKAQTVTTPAGKAGTLTDLLGPLGPDVFRKVFAFDLADLHQIGQLESDDQLRQQLFAAGLTGGGRSVAEVRRDLELAMEPLWRPRSTRKIRDLQAQLADKKAQLRKARHEAKRLPEANDEIRALEAQILEQEHEIEALRTQRFWLASVNNAYKPWISLLHTRSQLAAQVGLPLVDEQTLRDLDHLSAELQQAAQRLRDREEAMLRAKAVLQDLPATDAVLDHDQAIRELDRQRAGIEASVLASLSLEGKARSDTLTLQRLEAEVGSLQGMRRPTAAERAGWTTSASALVQRHTALQFEARTLDQDRKGHEDKVQATRQSLETLPQDPGAAAAAPRAVALVARWHEVIQERQASHPGAVSALAAAEQQRDQDCKRLSCALDTLPDWDTDTEQQHLEAVEAAATAHTRAGEHLQDADARLTRMQEDLDQARRQLGVEAAQERLLAKASEVRNLTAELQQARAARERMHDARDRLPAAQQALLRCLDKLGLADLPAELTLSDKQSLEALARRVLDARRDAVEGRRRAEDARPGEPSPTTEEVSAAEKRINDLITAQARLAATNAPAPTGRSARPWTVVSLLAALLFLVIGIGVLALWSTGLGATILVLAVFVGLIPGVLSLFAQSAPTGASSELRTILERLGMPHAGAAQVDAELPRAREHLDELSARHAAYGMWQAAVRQAEAQEQSAKILQREFAAWLAQHGLPERLDAGLASQWAAVLSDAHGAQHRLGELEAISAQAEAVWAPYEARATRLLDAIGVPPAKSVEARVAFASDRLTAAESLQSAYAAGVARIKQLEADLQEQTKTAKARGDALCGAESHLEQAWGRAREIFGAHASLAPAGLRAWLERVRAARQATERVQALQADLDASRAIVGRWQADLTDLATELAEPAGADLLTRLAARCEAAAAASRKAESLHERLREAEVAFQSAKDALDAHRAQKQQYEADLAEWLATCQAAGLPTTLSPANASELLPAIEEAWKAQTSLRDVRAELDKAEALQAAFVEAVTPVGGALNLPAPASTAEATGAVRALVQRLHEAKTVEKERHAATSALQAAVTAMEQAAEARDRSEAQRDEALLEAGMASMTEAREAADRYAKAKVLEAAEHACTVEIRALTGRVPSDPELVAALSRAPAEREAELATLSEGLQQTKEALEQAKQRLTLAIAAREALLAQADVVQIASDVTAIEADLQQVVRTFVRLKLADHMLDQSLERFRREKQPGVIKRAGELLRLITRQAWLGVRESLVGPQLEVLDANGHAKDPAVLSRGTKEQLYLCLRLALSETLAGDEGGMPIILDDVLVNFDPERSEACADVLAHIARDRQVLLFTCRPESERALRLAAGRANQAMKTVRLARFAGREAPAQLDPSPAATRTAASSAAIQIDGTKLKEVLRALQRSTEPLTKGELLSRVPMSDDEWRVLADFLKTDPSVRITGQKRGTRYQAV